MLGSFVRLRADCDSPRGAPTVETYDVEESITESFGFASVPNSSIGVVANVGLTQLSDRATAPTAANEEPSSATRSRKRERIPQVDEDEKTATRQQAAPAGSPDDCRLGCSRLLAGMLLGAMGAGLVLGANTHLIAPAAVGRNRSSHYSRPSVAATATATATATLHEAPSSPPPLNSVPSAPSEAEKVALHRSPFSPPVALPPPPSNVAPLAPLTPDVSVSASLASQPQPPPLHPLPSPSPRVPPSPSLPYPAPPPREPPVLPSPAPLLFSRISQIVSLADSGRCLDVTPEPQHSVVMAPCDGSREEQRFYADGHFEHFGDGGRSNAITIHWKHDHAFCLDMYVDIGLLNLFKCHGGANQKWYTDVNGRWRSMANDRCFDLRRVPQATACTEPAAAAQLIRFSSWSPPPSPPPFPPEKAPHPPPPRPPPPPAPSGAEPINRRFVQGEASNDIASAGVLTHQTDDMNLDRSRAQWLPAQGRYEDRMAASVINRERIAQHSTSWLCAPLCVCLLPARERDGQPT